MTLLVTATIASAGFVVASRKLLPARA